MDILVSSNFERLLWHLTLDHELETNPHVKIEISIRAAGAKINGWFQQLKTTGSFTVDDDIWMRAKEIFGTYRVSNAETVDAIRDAYAGTSIERKGYILDPHSAIGVTASIRELQQNPDDELPVISLATAHPAKFANAVELALKDEKDFSFEKILPEQFVGLAKMEKKVIEVGANAGLEGIREIIMREVGREKEARAEANGV